MLCTLTLRVSLTNLFLQLPGVASTSQATEAAAAAAAAEAAQAPGGSQQQQRSGTGSDPGQAQYAAAAAQNVINLDSHLAAKAGRPTGGAPAVGRKAAGADDDWGEEPLGDDLLPM
jgi:hypothetical protein